MSNSIFSLLALPFSITLFLLIVLPSLLFSQSQNFQIPIEGKEGEDFFIVNYVDHAPGQGTIRDYRCGTKTYDGHQGTDFTLRNFAQMDSGTSILAAADGIVFHVVDTLFDRNKESVIERGFGNWIGIAHNGGWYTYYAHIRKNSATVQSGDSVHVGEPIALVGSSGNSTDPHLHFEVWKIDTTLHDPFGPGDCGTTVSLWKNQPTYDTDYRLIDYGLTGFVPTLDTLRERPPTSTRFAPPDSVVAFWIHQQGLHRGDVVRIEWRRTSDNILWFDYEFPAETQDWWYHYFWSYIDLPPNDEYRVRYSINGQSIATETFTTGDVTGVRGETPQQPAISLRYLPGEWNILAVSVVEGSTAQEISVDMFDLLGRHVAQLLDREVIFSRRLIDLKGLHLPRGEYILHIGTEGKSMTLPIIMDDNL